MKKNTKNKPSRHKGRKKGAFMYNHLCLVLCLYGWIYMVGLTVGVYGGVLWWDFKLSFSTKYFDISSQSAHTDSLKLSSGWNALVIEKILLNRQCGEKKLVIPTRRLLAVVIFIFPPPELRYLQAPRWVQWRTWRCLCHWPARADPGPSPHWPCPPATTRDRVILSSDPH